MSDLPSSSRGGDRLSLAGASLAETRGEIDSTASVAKQKAADIDAAFAKAGESIAKSLGKAASDGKISLAELASAAIKAIEAFGKSSGSGASGDAGGLGSALASLLSSAFSGAKADGGPVVAGGAYLVGERGPEVFRPSGGGEIASASGGGTTVNVTVAGGGGAPALLRSEAQIASALARAVALGAR